MKEALKPFWVYWGILFAGCILFLICPLLFIIVLPVLLIIIPLWFGVVYMIGNAVQIRSGADRISRRMALAVLCTFLTVMIFPVCTWVDDIVRWKGLQLGSFVNNFKDMIFWIVSFIHFLVFWIGEETGRMGNRETEDTAQKTE